MTEPIHPVPLAPLSCACGEPLEVVERGDVRDLVCPRGCAVALAPNVRKKPARICPRCDKPIERVPGQGGRPAALHNACRTPKELADLASTHAWNAKRKAAKRDRGAS